jgi:hypothetical protein
MERIQRFGRGERGWMVIAEDALAPAKGWAIRAVTKEVYRDGENVGTCTDFQMGSPGDRAFKELRYEPLDPAE